MIIELAVSVCHLCPYFFLSSRRLIHRRHRIVPRHRAVAQPRDLWEELGNHIYLFLSSVTLADVVLGLSVNRWFMTPMDRPVLPAVSAYYDRLAQREGYRAHGRNGTP